MRLVVQADDLTGALDTGVMLSNAGIPTRVGWGALGDEPVQVVDTQSRHLSPDAAYNAVYDLARQAREAGAGWFYKKLDSTLRGNVRTELQAVADGFSRPVHLCPAYPALGRTTRGGVQLLNGRRLEETPLASDSQNPVTTGDLKKILGPLYGRDVMVYDALTEDDLEALSARLGGERCFGGSAGWAKWLPDLCGLEPQALPDLPRARRILLLAGSQSPVSQRQMKRAQGYAKVALGPGDVDALKSALSQGHAMLTTGGYIAGQESDIARMLGEAAAQAMGPGTLLCCFGGDTAWAAMRAMGVHAIHPIAEAAPGVPVSRAQGKYPFALVTKAGAFGGDDVLKTIEDFID